MKNQIIQCAGISLVSRKNLCSVISLGMFSFLILYSSSDIFGEGYAQEDSTGGRDAQSFYFNRSHAVRPEGLLSVDSNRGSIEINIVEQNEVSVEVVRKIDARYLEKAEEILSQHKIDILTDGTNVTVNSRIIPGRIDDIRVDGLAKGMTENLGNIIQKEFNSSLQSVQFRISVPRAYNVNLITRGGKIVVGNLSGNVHCQTSGGGIQLGRISGRVSAVTTGGGIFLESCGDAVEVATSGGSIRIGDVDGAAAAVTSGGSIQLGKIRGAVIAKTSGGSIHIGKAEGAVEAETSGGSISAVIASQPGRDSNFSTTGGSIRIGLAKDLALTVETRGRVSAPFLPGNQKQSNGHQSSPLQLNGGGPTLFAANASGGNILFYIVDSVESH